MSHAFFWAAFLILIYTYLVFPLIVLVRGRLFPRPVHGGDDQLAISVIIAAYNEEDSIGEKIENLKRCDYPADRLEVIVASDGSTDRTDAIVDEHTDHRIKLLSLPRQGKAAAINAACELATKEILVFSDANSMFDTGALAALVSPFADPRVGGVAGDQRYSKQLAQSATDEGERTYWSFDRLLKEFESRAGNVIGATGAIYAIRRSLFQPVMEGVTDDFTISTGVIAQGYRLVFEGRAIAREPVAGRSSDEFRRKTRVITRGFRSLFVRRRLFNPLRYGFYSIQLLSHKLLRRTMVIPLIVIFATSLLLSRQNTVYALAAGLQSAWYLLALIGFLAARTNWGRRKWFSIPAYFVMVNVACLVALKRILTGAKVTRWEPVRATSVQTVLATGGDASCGNR